VRAVDPAPTVLCLDKVRHWIGGLLLACLSPLTTFASVSPPTPTTNDSVVYFIEEPRYCDTQITKRIQGFQITITMDTNGPCFEGHVFKVDLGSLPAGMYVVTVNANVFRSFQDSFVVTQGAPIPALERLALAALLITLAVLGTLLVRSAGQAVG
jgi:hypothetical protein